MAGGQDRGVALLNALVVAAAIAGVATLLMRTAETGRDRLSMIRNSDQMALYLDGVSLLVPRILKADWSEGAALDHLGEIWASEDYSFPIDRGVAAGRISEPHHL